MRNNALFWFLFTLSPLGLTGQEAILLHNPSFEDVPGPSKRLAGWYDCGFEGETAPDIHPSGDFGVTQPPQDGRSYLGMVVRDNGTWEAVGQELPMPFSLGTCYGFSIHAARSQLYLSLSRLNNEPVNYDVPTRLRVWGGYDPCGREELLWETMAVPFFAWTRLDMVLRSSASYTHLILEAFYDREALEPYNGNLLLDNASLLLPVDCDNPRISALPLEVLEAPEFSGLRDLQAFLAAQARQVQFDLDRDALEKQLIKTEDGAIVHVNRHLWLIGRAMAQYHKLKLDIFLPGGLEEVSNVYDVGLYRYPESAQVQKEWVAATLAAAGFDADRYTIGTGGMPKAQRKAPWLLPARGHQFNLRLRGKLYRANSGFVAAGSLSPLREQGAREGGRQNLSWFIIK